MATVGNQFKPGEEVPNSGIYKVVHDSYHAAEHEVTCVQAGATCRSSSPPTAVS